MESVNEILVKVQDEWLKRKSDKSTKITIGAAVALVLLYTVYDKVAKPPRKLRKLPYVNFFSYFKMMLRGESYGAISRKLTIPLLKPNQPEMYVQKDLLGWTVKICDPVLAKQIFFKTDIYAKANLGEQEGTLRQNHVGSNNIVMTHEQDVWKKHRLLVNPSFHKSMPIALFSELTNRMLKVMDKSGDELMDVTNLMDRLTLDVIGKAGFGFDFNASLDPHSEWVEIYDTIKKAQQIPLFFFFPFLETKFLWLFPKRKHMHQLSIKFHKMLDEVIENKRKSLKVHAHIDDADKDLLTLMLEGEEKGEGNLTTEELNSNLNIFFAAGHDTTSNTLASCLYYLAKHKDVQQRAREEAIRVFGDEPKDITPNVDQLKELVYIYQVMKETLRMNGPASQITPRYTKKDVEVDGVIIPKDTKITVSIYDIHHNPFVWKDPEVFNPDRFAEGGEAEQKGRGGLSWIPFANGPRMCIGMNFSLAEQRVILSAFLRKYEWELPKDSIHKDTLVTNNLFLITPKELKINFTRRY